MQLSPRQAVPSRLCALPPKLPQGCLTLNIQVSALVGDCFLPPTAGPEIMVDHACQTP